MTAFIAAVSILTAHDVLVGPGGVPASASSGQLARSTVVAQPGDTLWSIATEHRGDVPISRYVDKLVELNDGAGIQAGQRIVLP
ncbi:MAG TPA: LysM domain-containing protein [Ilumatobacter sp.]|nr:LysM domain-containing protein [Ilumatobacter sp.]